MPLKNAMGKTTSSIGHPLRIEDSELIKVICQIDISSSDVNE